MTEVVDRPTASVPSGDDQGDDFELPFHGDADELIPVESASEPIAMSSTTPASR